MNETSPLEFRVASEEDLPSLLTLYCELESPDQHPSPDKLATAFREVSNDPRSTVWVAQRDGEIVGTFQLAIFEALGARCKPVGIVEDVVVARHERGRGVGKEMMQFALEQCRKRGCYKMQLSSNLRRDDAHRFYDALGFERHGVSFLVRNE